MKQKKLAWEQVQKFVSKKSEGADWKDAHWISFSNAHGEDLCPDDVCAEEVAEIVEAHFEITSGIDFETCYFNAENCKKVAELICEHFAEKWYDYYFQKKGERALDLLGYKEELVYELIDGVGSREADLFEFDEITGERLNTWPTYEDAVIDELEVLLEYDSLDVDDWESINRMMRNFDDSAKVKSLVRKIVKKHYETPQT